jgi:hypothetical protein
MKGVTLLTLQYHPYILGGNAPHVKRLQGPSSTAAAVAKTGR